MSGIVHTEPGVTHGVLLQQQPGRVVLGLSDTEYQLHLATTHTVQAAPPGNTLRGRVVARAKRIDPARSGGRFIEPLYGRPRRVQGVVVAADPAGNTLSVQCAPGFCLLATLTDPRQKAGDFALGQLVGFDVERGAAFEPM